MEVTSPILYYAQENIRESHYYFNNNPHNVGVHPASYLWYCLRGEMVGFSASASCPYFGHQAGLIPFGKWSLVGQQALRMTLPSLTEFLCDFGVPIFLIERAQSNSQEMCIWFLHQVLPQMHYPRLSLLSCSLKELVGLRSKTLSVATFPIFKQNLRPLNSPHRSS